MTGSGQSDNLSSTGIRWTPRTEAERRSVREELARVLADPLFRNSKRYPTFLEHVVEQTLNGQAESLKERTVGIEVFGRRPDYDTNVDHMVRNVAVEVRKRLSEYYETSSLSGIRIEIPAGSYAAQFRVLESAPVSDPVIPSAHSPAGRDVATAEAIAIAPVVGRISQRTRLAIAGTILAIVTAGLWLRSVMGQTAVDRFWGPIWKSPGAVVFCIAGPEGFPLEPGPDAPRPESLADSQRLRSLVNFSDSLTMLRLAFMAQSHGKDYRVLYSRESRVSDLYAGPAVLIGTGDDELVRLMSADLRFHFQHDGSRSYIVDSQNLKQNDWVVDWLTPYNQLTRDYAIVWRVRGSYSGSYVIGIAGITRIAVAGMGDLLSSPAGLAALERATPGAWRDKNAEIVLRVQVDRGSPFPPEVIASHVW
jgi:hypothetical protein